MPIQRKNLFLTWGIRISLVPVILVLPRGGSIRHRVIPAQPLRRAAGAVLAGQKAARVCW